MDGILQPVNLNLEKNPLLVSLNETKTKRGFCLTI